MKNLTKYVFLFSLIEYTIYLILNPESIELFFLLFVIIYGISLALNILNSSDYNYTFLDCGASAHPYQLDNQIKRNFNPKVKSQNKVLNSRRLAYIFLLLFNIFAYLIIKLV